ncbi:MAG: ADP-ribosylglycohydrolase family protein [Sedimentisphaerales bacterium]|nr:ADP-ribosylglycohydrolase family protein [Sedimentisphaerales bacterium]
MTKKMLLIAALSVGSLVFAEGPATTTDYVKIYDQSIGESQQWYINDHCFIYGHDGKWHLYGITDPEPMNPGDEDELVHASCETLDGVWEKEPFALTVRPDLKETYLWAPYVVKDNDVYYMYYCAGGWPNDQHQISIATSKDLYTWKRYEKNPIIVDGYDARDPFVLKDGGRWILYYTATSTPKGGNHVVKAITSTDLLDWSKKPVTVYKDKSTGTWGGPTESPYVIKRGDYYYLLIGPRDMQYRWTSVYKGKDPLKWTDKDYVTKINSHAAEVVRNFNGDWYVSHCGWGQGGVYLAGLEWNDGLDKKATSYDPPVKVAPEKVEANTYRILMKDYRSKMLAGWVGQMVAVTWGFPVEFKYLGKMVPEKDVPKWKPEMINDAFNQDDLYVEMTFLRSMQKRGIDVTTRLAGFDFAESKYPLWHANKAARDNLRKGIAPPDSGHPEFNSHADDIDFQIEADFAGLLSPAMPARAVEIAGRFGSIMNYGDGKYGGLFVAAMYSYAFVENNIEVVVNKALEVVPKQSLYYEAISDTIKWHKQYPDNWEKTWHLINDKYQKNPEYRKTSCDKGDFNIDAKINGAYIVMGLLYGKGNVEDTIVISMRCGQDADCNPSNAAGVLFTMLGMERIHHQYRKYDEDTNFQYTKYDMLSLVDVCEVLARRNVLLAGGKIEVDKFGNEVLIINSKPVKAVPFEDTRNPKPAAKTTYTDWELKQMKK